MVAMQYGSYTLGESIGRGGMGVVYKAEHVVLGERACVKVLLPEFTQVAEVVERFRNEAKAAAGLSGADDPNREAHRNIVKVKDCNQGPDGVWFIVLEYLVGLPLSKWMTYPAGQRHESGIGPRVEGNGIGGLVSTPLVIRILAQVANALHAAHEYKSDHIAGIVHRDVKPDNIFIVARRYGSLLNDLHVVLLDFGIAKLREAHGDNLTRTGATIGTPAYMAPEQLANSKAVDRRADVYALGVILYQMLTGWLPWCEPNGDTPAHTEIYRRQTSEPPPDPRARNPAVSAGLAYVVVRALACDPRERWGSAEEFARALAEVDPAGNEILRKWAEELWDPNDPMFGRRLGAPPISRADDAGWKPPLSAVSFVASSATPRHGDATRSLGPPPMGAPVSTLGASAAQSVPNVSAPRRSRAGLYAALGAVVAAGGIALAVSISGGTAKPTASEPAAGSAIAPADASAATTSVAVLTEPAGAAVFVDDELVGTSPTKVQLVAGRSVNVRAELAGHQSTETRHTVGQRAETVRLNFASIDAAVPVDAGVDAAPATSRTGTGHRPGGGRRPPAGTTGGAASPGGGSGSDKANGFDPEGIAR